MRRARCGQRFHVGELDAQSPEISVPACGPRITLRLVIRLMTRSSAPFAPHLQPQVERRAHRQPLGRASFAVAFEQVTAHFLGEISAVKMWPVVRTRRQRLLALLGIGLLDPAVLKEAVKMTLVRSIARYRVRTGCNTAGALGSGKMAAPRR